jgi:hypothetical protein
LSGRSKLFVLREDHAFFVGHDSSEYIGGITDQASRIQYQATVGVFQNAAGGVSHHENGRPGGA